MEYKTEKYTLYNDDCITVLDNMIQNGDTVDMIFTDPPCGMLKTKWCSLC